MTREDAIKVAYGIPVTKAQHEALQFLIPELAESEDERIRQELIGGLMWQRDNLEAIGPHDDNIILPGFTMKVGNIIDSLRKQKEQKPAEWSEEDKDNIDCVIDLLYVLDSYIGDDCSMSQEKAEEIRNKIQKETCPWLKSLRPQPKRDGGDDYNNGYIKGRADTLKEFNDMASWKPSEEQMRALNAVIKHLLVETPERHRLEEIYEQLKKLI